MRTIGSVGNTAWGEIPAAEVMAVMSELLAVPATALAASTARA